MIGRSNGEGVGSFAGVQRKESKLSCGMSGPVMIQATGQLQGIRSRTVNGTDHACTLPLAADPAGQ